MADAAVAATTESVKVAVKVVGQGPLWPQGGIGNPFSQCLNGDSCSGLLYEDNFLVFLFFLIGLAGLCAFTAGRATARGWQPITAIIPNMLLFTIAIRFLLWGIFRNTLFHPYYFVVDALVLIAIATLGFQLTRTYQMTTQYYWLYRRVGPLAWAKR